MGSDDRVRAQIKAGRAFLGWSQEDLAEAAGLHPNAIRYYEAQHARPFSWETANGYGVERITIAFHKAGLTLCSSPPGVAINPDIYKPRKPPTMKRWEKTWKANSKRGRRRQYEISMARLMRQWPQMPEAAALEWYADFHASRAGA